MSQLAPLSQALFSLKVLSGKDKGVVYQINKSKIIIGRDTSCDIVTADDTKCSRHHIQIEFIDNRFKVVNISNKSKVYVNKQEIIEAQLLNNSVILIGNTQFMFILGAPVTTTANQQLAEKPSAGALHSNHKRPRNKKRTKKTKSKSNVYIVFLLIIIGMAWLLTSEPDKKKVEEDITTEQDITKSVDKLNSQIQKKKEEKRLSGENTQEYKLAQSYYLKGFRDYKKGQYERAIKHFNGCLGIFTNHTECNRYILLARKKQDELIQYHIHLGRQYKQQNQFSACKSAFRNVMYMIKNAQDPRYNEAKSNYEFCHESLEGTL